ncbi:MAG: hypothetical protein U5N55_03470 [Cypionkella sp.]|nr:hypothetical protein [Cypionkella sp.]
MTMPKPYIGPDDEVAELDSAWAAGAKRGRPSLPAPLRKQRVNIMLDADLCSSFAPVEKDGRRGSTPLYEEMQGCDTAGAEKYCFSQG